MLIVGARLSAVLLISESSKVEGIVMSRGGRTGLSTVRADGMCWNWMEAVGWGQKGVLNKAA